jgi:hypothetical protein
VRGEMEYHIVHARSGSLAWCQTIYHRDAAERLLAELGPGFAIKESHVH